MVKSSFRTTFWIVDSDLEKMNENKKGKKYKFPDSFILVIDYMHMYLISFTLQTKTDKDRGGIIKATGKTLQDHPSYGYICKRINRLNIAIKECKTDDDDNDYIVIGVETVQVSR